MITGKVMDLGFRTMIEDIAKFHDLKGYAFNDIDDSVKIVCSGDNGIIEAFLDEVRFRGIQKGAQIQSIEKEEITQRIYLPPKFLRLYTDELADIARKLDKGNDFLGKIMQNTDILPEMFAAQKEHNKVQLDFNQEMREHNKRIEKLLEKIAEK